MSKIPTQCPKRRSNVQNPEKQKETAQVFFDTEKAEFLFGHTPGLYVKGDDDMLIGSRKLLEGCQRPLQSHYIEHFKGHFVLMDQVLTQTALSAVLVRTTNTAVRKQAQEIK